MSSATRRENDPAAAAAAIEALAKVEGRGSLYAHYDVLRAADPIHRSQHPLFPNCWFVSRHADIHQLLRDRRFVQDSRNSEVFAGSEGAFAEMVSRILIFLPPAAHQRTRDLVYRAFTPQQVARRRPRIEALVDELLSALERGRECDLLQEVLYALPMTVICELLGATQEDRAVFEDTFSVQAAEVSDVGSATPEQRQAADRAVERFSVSVRALIRKHRDHPNDGILAKLIEAADDGDRLSEDEIVAAIYILIGAGHETTANLLGNGLAHLLGEHRDQWDRLVREPELVPSAVEELLRFDTSVQFNQRVANEDVVFNGVEIKENERIIVLLGAANRDPEVFAEPQRLDIGRDPNPHLAFGAGANYCLGTHLARLQMTIALDALVRRMPELRLVSEPDWRPTWMMRGLRALPVALSP